MFNHFISADRAKPSRSSPCRGLVALAAGLICTLASPAMSQVHAEENRAPAGQFRVTGTGGAALRLRGGPSTTTPIVGRLAEGTTVTLSAGAATEAGGERWLPVKAREMSGWVAARYLTRIEPLKPVVRQLPADAPLSDRVAATAEATLGQPYVWAGAAPGGFDCSGLVQWVYNQVGMRVPRTVVEQLAAGKKVDETGLKAGDLVTFKNTYRQGLSHVGIYLGSNRFVHAADEAHGVTVSNIKDEYWKPRFHQAVRLPVVSNQ